MTFDQLYTLILERKKKMPSKSYITSLCKRGEDNVIQKIGEEAIEVIIAAKNGHKKQIIAEVADLYFHILIMLTTQEITLQDIYQELEKRNK